MSHSGATPTTLPPPTSSVRQDLTRITLAVVTLFLLTGAALWVLRPFLAAGVWGDVAGRLHLAAHEVPGGPARREAGSGSRGDDARPAAPADRPPGGGDLHPGPACRRAEGLGAIGGGLRPAAATLVGRRAPRHRPEARGRLGGRRKGRPRWPRRPTGALLHEPPELGARPRRHRGRPAGPFPPRRGLLRHPVRQRRSGGARRPPLRPASCGQSAATAPSSWPARPFEPWRWVSA